LTDWKVSSKLKAKESKDEVKMKQLSINNIVKILEEEGFKINRRTFWYYIEIDLVPKPLSTRKTKGVQGFYPITILEPLRKVLKWRDEGYPLKSLKDKLASETTADIYKIFRKYGLDVTLSEFHSYLNVESLDLLSDDEVSCQNRVDSHEKKVISSLLNDTMWESSIEREKIVVEYRIKSLKSDLLTGYTAALGDFSRSRKKFEEIIVEEFEKEYRSDDPKKPALKKIASNTYDRIYFELVNEASKISKKNDALESALTKLSCQE
jgi:DNA-binding transcriptional MerR regulator